MQSPYLPLILAGALAVPAVVEAETVIYGRLRSNLADPGSEADAGTRSRFGLKGSEETGKGLKALYQLEWQVDAANGLSTRNVRLEERPDFLASDWGMTPFGRPWASYRSDLDHADILDLSMGYRKGPLSVGTTYLNYRQGDLEDRESWGATTRYRFSDFALTAQYEYDQAGVLENSDGWSLMGEYYLGNNVLRATYSDRDWDESTTHKWTLGLMHQFNKGTSFYAEFQDQDNDAQQRYGAGIRHNF
jgi:predicted porin